MRVLLGEDLSQKNAIMSAPLRSGRIVSERRRGMNDFRVLNFAGTVLFLLALLLAILSL